MKKYYGLHVDDNKKCCLELREMFDGYGIVLDNVQNINEGIKKIQNNKKYSFVFMDIKFENNRIDGIDAAKIIKNIDPLLPLFLVSAYINDNVYFEKIQSSDIFGKIVKPLPIKQSNDFKEIVKSVKDSTNAYDEVKNFYKINYNEFILLPDEQLDVIFEKIYLDNKTFIDKEFIDNKKNEWMIIANGRNIIVQSGEKNVPNEKYLNELSKKLNVPVFCYTRPKIIEEIIPQNWSICENGTDNNRDYYPAISILFKNYDSEYTIKSDFDTGSPYSFIGYDMLLKEKIIQRMIFQKYSKNVLWGVEYSYYDKDLNCYLKSQDNDDISVFLSCRLVKKWETCPLVMHYKKRSALIGRNILMNNEIKIILDGKYKKTFIRSHDEPN